MPKTEDDDDTYSNMYKLLLIMNFKETNAAGRRDYLEIWDWLMEVSSGIWW